MSLGHIRDNVRDLLVEAAERFVLPRFQALRHHDIEEKTPGDLVTVADLEAEAFLTERLQKLLPGAAVVGEEAFSRDAAVLEALSGDAETVWVIDPVDGTVNFANGRETFCIMVALVRNQETVFAWIHDPLSGKTAIAEQGGGTYWGDARLLTPSPPAWSKMVGQINFGYFDPEDRKHLKDAALTRFGTLRRIGCAGHDFLRQARGERHFAFYRRLWSWDHIPGSLVLREAGGHVEPLRHREYRLKDRVPGLLTALNNDLWNDLNAFLTPWDRQS